MITKYYSMKKREQILKTEIFLIIQQMLPALDSRIMGNFYLLELFSILQTFYMSIY